MATKHAARRTGQRAGSLLTAAIGVAFIAVALFRRLSTMPSATTLVAVATFSTIALGRFFYVRWQLLRTISYNSFLHGRRDWERDSKVHAFPTELGGVEKWLRARDGSEAPLQPGAESQVKWANVFRRQTGLCVVFLHGWGASPPEVAPVDERLAEALGANLLRFRLTGHGYAPEEGKSGEELHRGGVAVAERQSHLQLRRDAAAAFALGRLLGERVVLVGCSTGGSLAVWLSGQPWVQRKIAAIVLVSPAFRLTAPYAVWVVFSWLILLSPRAVAALILRGFNGFHFLKRPSPKLSGDRGAAQARCWTRAWPIEAVRHVIGLYVVVRATVSYAKIRVPVLAFANPKDGAVSFEATREAVGRMRRGELEVVTDSENRHVITGAILSPSTVERVTRRAVDFCVMVTADDFADAADIDAPPAAAGAAGPGPSLSKMK